MASYVDDSSGLGSVGHLSSTTIVPVKTSFVFALAGSSSVSDYVPGYKGWVQPSSGPTDTDK